MADYALIKRGVSMKAILRVLLSLMLLLFLAAPEIARAQGTLRFAELGDFRLENGKVIRTCRLGYRTWGDLNEDRSNALLFPTWLAGTTEELVNLGLIGSGKLADTSRYFVVAVESLGNGVSSSPSNSKEQPLDSFPEFTIRDMVNAEHLLLTRHFHLHRLRAVIGISMGGMQTFQWMISYPHFVQKAVSIMGSPRMTSHDLLILHAELRAIEATRGVQGGDALGMKTLAAIHAYAVRTPQYYVRRITPEELPRFLAETEKGLMKYSLNDWAGQLKAIIAHDIYKSPGKSEEETTETIRTKLLLIVARDDFMVNPEPSVAMAKLLKSETIVLQSDCGHFTFLCEAAKIQEAVASFLVRED
jgi:homoserine O-acetyltransferase